MTTLSETCSALIFEWFDDLDGIRMEVTRGENCPEQIFLMACAARKLVGDGLIETGMKIRDLD